MVMTIESASNPIIKEAASLHQKKKRDENNVLLVEGKHPIEEAVKAKLEVYQNFVLDEKSFTPNISDNALQIITSKQAMSRLSSTDSPAPCVAVVEKPKPYQLSELLPTSQAPFVLVLDKLQDPGNLGTLIRSAKAFGASAVLLTRNSVDPFSPKVIRSSAGLVFSLPVISSDKALEDSLKELHQLGFQLILTRGDNASENNGTSDYKSISYTKASALVLGNEGTGINADALSDIETIHWTSIPMTAGVDSLNVGVCGSIILAEAAAQRQEK